MKVFITKYALSQGIIEVEVEQSESHPSLVTEVKSDWFKQSFRGEGKEWHRDIAGAKKVADDMRLRKLSSLKKQIAKLEKLSFQ